MTDIPALLQKALAAGGAAHLHRDGVAVVGVDAALAAELKRREVLAYLRANPGCDEAEKARKLLFRRMLERLRPLFSSQRLRDLQDGKFGALMEEILKKEDRLSELWVDARQSEEAARRFPAALQDLQRAWRNALKIHEEE